MHRPLITMLCLAVLASPACVHQGSVVDLMTGIQRSTGWFEIKPKISIDENGRLFPYLTPDEAEAQREAEAKLDASDRPTRAQRVKAAYNAQFSSVTLHPKRACAALTAGRDKSGPVYILVPGVQGDGLEWWPVIPTLHQTKPAAIFMYRWLAPMERGVVIQGLVEGVNLLTECFEHSGPIVVLAHSAGGVISSFAAHKFHPPPSEDSAPLLHILTVASPLAGTGYRERDEDGDTTRVINDLGTAQRTYPAAAKGVAVTHFRTQYPADSVMKPNVFGHEPNQRGVGVTGAREVDLPAHLGHDPSLLYVARQLVAGNALEPTSVRSTAD